MDRMRIPLRIVSMSLIVILVEGSTNLTGLLQNGTYDVIEDKLCTAPIDPTLSPLLEPILSLKVIREEHFSNSSRSRQDATNPLDVFKAFQSQKNVVLHTTCERYLDATSLTSRWTQGHDGVSGDIQGLKCLELLGPGLAEAVVDLILHETIENIAVLYTEMYVAFLDHLIHPLQEIHVEHTMYSLAGRIVNDTGWAGLMETVSGFLLLADGHEDYILTQARRLDALKPDYKWIVVTNNASDDRWSQLLLPWERIILLEVKWPDETCPFYNIQELPQHETFPVWRVNSGKRMIERVGQWTNTGLEIPFDLWEFRQFHNKHFNIVTIHLPIFHYKEVHDGKISWHGICIEILNQLAGSLNFSYNLVEPYDQKWGLRLDDGTWNGMVGMVKRGEVDWALGKFTVSKERDSVIDFADPFWHEATMMVYRLPDEQSLKVYIGPFKWQVWLLFIVSVPFMGFMTTTIVVLSPVYRQLVKISNFRHRLTYFLKETTWYIYGAALQQGGVWYPHSQASKFLIGFWWFFTLALTATYTGNLIAFLTVPRTELPVQTVRDLAEQSFYDYGVVDGSALHNLLMVANQPTYQELFKKKVHLIENRVRNHAHGLERALKENYVYIGEMSGVAPKVYSDCRYTVAKETFFPSSFAFVFPEDSPYIPLISDRISKMLEGGLVQRWRRVYYPPNLCSKQKSIEMPKAASLKTTQGAFYVLFIGMGISFIVLWTECIIKCTRTNQSASVRSGNKGLAKAIQIHLAANGTKATGLPVPNGIGAEFKDFQTTNFSEITAVSTNGELYQNGNAMLH